MYSPQFLMLPWMPVAKVSLSLFMVAFVYSCFRVPVPTACPLFWMTLPTPPTALPATFPAAVMPLDSMPMAVFWI
jgi:hypothetical protein